MKKQCIEDPDDIDWKKFWVEKLREKRDRKKDWNKVAPKFHKRAQKDDYQELLFSNLILDKEDTVLDLGCGEGSITLPLAKKVKSVTGLDSAYKMLELLNERAEKYNIDNVSTIEEDLNDISYEKLGDYDVVLASRCLNGIEDIDEKLKEINKIANKYVFITFFGPENWMIEKDFQRYLDKESKEFPGPNYIYNILYNMGIYPNVNRLEIKAYRKYDSIEEAMDNGKYRSDLLNDEEKEKLKEFLKENLKIEEETGKYYNEKDKADWILFWWKK